MASIPLPSTQERIYRGFLLAMLIKAFMLISMGALFIQQALQPGGTLWWLGVIIVAGLGTLVASHFNSQVVIVSQTHIIVRHGYLTLSTHPIALWSLTVEAHQSLPGRVFGYGSVSFRTAERTITLKQIAHVSDLCTTVTQRQAELMFVLAEARHWNTLAPQQRAVGHLPPMP
jgi:hypothetical protein